MGVVAEVPEKTLVYPTYTVTTSGGTNDLAAAQVEVVAAEGAEPVTAAFSSLKPLTQGTFIKKGEGYLNLTTDMGGFLGSFWVEEGALVVTEPGQLGPKNDTAGTIWIASGASLGLNVQMALSGQIMNIFNWMYVVGAGYQGKGALYNDSLDAIVGSNNMCACFKGRIELLGDTTFGGAGGRWGDHGNFKGYFLNGHTLTIACKGLYRTNGGILHNGHVVVTGGGMNPQSNLYFMDGTENSLSFNAGTWSGYHAGKINLYSPWTLYLAGGVKFAFGGNESNAKANWNSLNYDNWNGPAVVTGTVSVENTGFANTIAAYPFSFNGPVSGAGGFNVKRGWLHFSDPTNTFTGPLSVNQSDTRYVAGVGLFDKAAYPGGNGNVFTNKNGALYITKLETRLPDMDYTVDNGWTNGVVFGDGSATAASLVKRGAGLLDVSIPLSVTGRTELVAGTLRFKNQDAAIALQYSSVPGLYEGTVGFGTNNTEYMDAKDAYHTTGDVAVTNGVAFRPEKAYRYGPSYWEKYEFARYQGYIWNRTETTADWSFALALAGGGKLLIDDEVVVENLHHNWYFLWTNTVSIAPGPHKFDLRLYNQGYSQGGYRQPYLYWYGNGSSRDADYDTWANGIGFAYDPNGRGRDVATAFNSDNYLMTSNNVAQAFVGGDGVLFTRDARTQDECKDEIVAVVRGRFAELVARPEAVLDLSGSQWPMSVATLEGILTVTNGSLKVESAWKIAAADVNAGGKLAVNGTLTFADGATAAVDDAAWVANRGTLQVIAEADQIVGCPTPAPGMNVPGVNFVTSADGKTLSLYVPPRGTFVIFR